MEATIIDRNSAADMIRLLKENNLPFEDINLDGNIFLLYNDADHNLIGTGGLEFYDHYALLRSVSVAEDQRGKAFGKKIVQNLISRAKEKSITKLYLLTETAPAFFQKIGFVTIAREDVPDAVKESSEFATVCPISAVCMEIQVL